MLHSVISEEEEEGALSTGNVHTSGGGGGDGDSGSVVYTSSIKSVKRELVDSFQDIQNDSELVESTAGINKPAVQEID